MLNNHMPTENVEIASAERQYWVDMKESLDRLETNEDFKRVVLEGYFKDKAINGVSLLATDYVVNGGLRTRVMESLVAISQFEDFLKTIKDLGSASNELFDDYIDGEEA